MDLHAANTALRRARKRYAHASAQLGKADSESARKRHARRALNAQRGMKEAERTFSALAFSEA